MADAEDRGWGPGWPDCPADKQVTVEVGSNRITLRVHREIAVIFQALVLELEQSRGEPFRDGWCWGYNCRAIRGSNNPSNHSWGLAIDLDAPENPFLLASQHDDPHPLRQTYPGGIVLRSTMPMDAKAIAERWGCRWGGTYQSRPDPMHYEFMGTPTDARRLTARARQRLEADMPLNDDDKRWLKEFLALEVVQIARAQLPNYVWAHQMARVSDGRQLHASTFLRHAHDRAVAADAKLEAVLAATDGLDTDAVLARIDSHAAQTRAALEVLSDTLSGIHSLLGEFESGMLDAAAVVAKIGELLTAAVDESGDAAS